MRPARNSGFEGRTFLSQAEWETYCRRMPVRYIKGPRTAVCVVCGQPASVDNPFNHSHRIGFSMGIIDLGLTPDYVDGLWNIQTAHRKQCNSKVELGLGAALNLLMSRGITNLPAFLPESTHQAFQRTK